MDILARAMRTLADSRPSEAYTVLASTLEKGVADRDIEADDSTIVGRGIEEYAKRLTIADDKGHPLPPLTIKVHHDNYYSDAVIVSDHGDGITMISIPDTEEPFGIIAWPGERYQTITVD